MEVDSSGGSEQVPGKRRFEYTLVQEMRAKKLIEQLNELGAQGWEAVVITHPGLLLKRELR